MNDIEEIRQRDVQALHAAISNRDWQGVESAANKLRDNIDRLIAESPQPYVIWSNEHRAFWAWDRRGYVASLKDAGQYSRHEANAIAQNASGPMGVRYLNSNPNEIALPLADAMEQFK